MKRSIFDRDNSLFVRIALVKLFFSTRSFWFQIVVHSYYYTQCVLRVALIYSKKQIH